MYSWALFKLAAVPSQSHRNECCVRGWLWMWTDPQVQHGWYGYKTPRQLGHHSKPSCIRIPRNFSLSSRSSRLPLPRRSLCLGGYRCGGGVFTEGGRGVGEALPFAPLIIAIVALAELRGTGDKTGRGDVDRGEAEPCSFCLSFRGDETCEDRSDTGGVAGRSWSSGTVSSRSSIPAPALAAASTSRRASHFRRTTSQSARGEMGDASGVCENEKTGEEVGVRPLRIVLVMSSEGKTTSSARSVRRTSSRSGGVDVKITLICRER